MSSDGSRFPLVMLALSAAGLLGIVSFEGYSPTAVAPVPGDKPTYGFGSTAHADGSPVKAGETITPPKAIDLAVRQAQVKESAIKRCVKVPLAQYEYDAYVSLAYNIGESAFCASTLVDRLNAGEYSDACFHIGDFVCGPATEGNRAKPGERCFSKKKPMRVIPGLAARRQREAARCRGELK